MYVKYYNTACSFELVCGFTSLLSLGVHQKGGEPEP